MTSIDLPLQIISKGLKREERLKKSIDTAIYLIMTTACYSTPIDPQFGFVFNNLRFEMFNENEGVVFNSGDTKSMDGIQGLYEKKISGSSYIREERIIYVTVKGIIVNSKEEYAYQTKFRVWN